MTSTRSKGNAIEREAEYVFACWDYKTWRAKAVRRGYSKDIMGMFDIIAWDRCELILCQVKSRPQEAYTWKQKANKMDLPSTAVICVIARVPRKPHHFDVWVRVPNGKRGYKWRRGQFNPENDFADPHYWWYWSRGKEVSE